MTRYADLEKVCRALSLALGVLVGPASTAAQAVVAQASLSGQTLDDARGRTACSWRAHLDERVPLVRGQTSRIRVRAPQVDAGLKAVRVLGGGHGCAITRRSSGVERDMGFVELTIQVDALAPLGAQTLELSYPDATRTFQLLVIEPARIDVVAGLVRGPADRLVVTGRGLSALEAPPDFTTLEQTDTTWLLAPSGSFCRRDGQADYRAPLTATAFCGVRLPYFAVEPDQVCSRTPGAEPTPPPASPPLAGTTDLVPHVAGAPVRAWGVMLATPQGGVQSVPDVLCSGLTSGMQGSATLPPLTWSVTVLGDAPRADVIVQLVDATSGVVRDTLTLHAGEAHAQKQGYAGRPVALSVVRDPLTVLGTVLGGPRSKYPGCFTAPGSVPVLDPARLSVRVDPDSRVDEGPAGEANNRLDF